MTKTLKTISLACWIALTAACHSSISNYQYKGFNHAIDINKIKSIPEKTGARLLNINFPDTGTLTFDYNKQLKDTRFIPLEKTAESKIANIDKILLAEDRIIVVDLKVGRTIYIFDSRGHFINSILCADGVVDKKVMLSGILDVAYDYKYEEIVLHSPNKAKMYYFDKNGNFKNNTKEYIYFMRLANIQNSDSYIYLNCMGGNDHIPVLNKSAIYLGQRDTKIAYIANEAVKQMRPLAKYVLNDNPSINNSNEQLFYTPEFCDTVYQIMANPLQIIPKIRIHYPGPDLNSTLKASHKDNMTSYIKLANTGEYYSFQGEIIGNNEGVYYFATYKKQMTGYFYSERSGKLIGGDLYFRHSLPDSVQTDTYSYPFTTFHDYFVSILFTSNFKKTGANASGQLVELRKKIKPNDNPVLFFYKLKDF